MSKPPRDCTSFGTDVYFVTASTWGHRALLQTERIASLFIDTIFHYRDERKFLIHEFVVMPNHLHGLIVMEPLRRGVSHTPGGKFRSPAQTVGAIVRGFKGSTTRLSTSYREHQE